MYLQYGYDLKFCAKYYGFICLGDGQKSRRLGNWLLRRPYAHINQKSLWKG